MAASDELVSRYPGVRLYYLFASIREAEVNLVNEQTNVICARLQSLDNVMHYRSALSPSGASPATHLGAEGPVEYPEALGMIDLMDGLAADVANAWMLLPSRVVIWKKGTGFIEDGPVVSFDDFLTDIGSQKIQSEDQTTERSVGMYILLPKHLVPQAKPKIMKLIGDLVDPVKLKLSSNGELPATHFAGHWMLTRPQARDLVKDFPVNPGSQVDVYLVDSSGNVRWNNEVGPIKDSKISMKQIVRDNNLKIIRG